MVVLEERLRGNTGKKNNYKKENETKKRKRNHKKGELYTQREEAKELI